MLSSTIKSGYPHGMNARYKTLGPFEVLRGFSPGVMGRSYLCVDPSKRRPGRYLVKVYHPEYVRSPLFVEALRQSVADAQGFVHGYSVKTIAHGIHGQAAFVVRPYVSGVRVAEALQRQQVRGARGLGLGPAAAIGARIASVLGAAHTRSALHSGVSPSSLYLSDDGHPRVVDVGLVGLRQITGAWGKRVDFVAPEVLQGARWSRPADTYAFGATLFALLSGLQWSETTSLPEAIADELRRASEDGQGGRREVMELVLRMTSRNPAERPLDFDGLSERLLQVSTVTEGSDPRISTAEPASSSGPAMRNVFETGDLGAPASKEGA